MTAANAASATHDAITIDRPFTAPRLPAQRAHGREIAPRDGFEKRRQVLVRELLARSAPRCLAHSDLEVGIADQPADGPAHRADVAWLDHEAGLAVGDRFVRPPAAARDRGHAARGRLEEHD